MDSKDVNEFLKQNNFSEFKKVSFGSYFEVYDFLSEYNPNSTNFRGSILIISNDYGFKNLTYSKQASRRLFSKGVNILPILNYTKLSDNKCIFSKNKVDGCHCAIVLPKVAGINIFSPTLESTLKKLTYISYLSFDKIQKAFNDLLTLINSNFSCFKINPKNIIANKSGFYFVEPYFLSDKRDFDKSNIIADRLIELFENILGTHANIDTISFTETINRPFYDINDIVKPNYKIEYAQLLKQTFNKVAIALLNSAQNLDQNSRDKIFARVKTIKLNYVKEFTSLIEGENQNYIL